MCAIFPVIRVSRGRPLTLYTLKAQYSGYQCFRPYMLVLKEGFRTIKVCKYIAYRIGQTAYLLILVLKWPTTKLAQVLSLAFIWNGSFSLHV